MNILTTQTSLRKAALIAGLSTLIMTVCAPFAELYAYPKLFSAGSGEEVIHNIKDHHLLFAGLIMGYLITFIFDIVAAWALYALLKPVNAFLSLLTALFRLVFAIVAIISLLSLVNTFRILSAPDILAMFKPDQIQSQVVLSIHSFRFGFHFGLIFFGIYLIMLGCLVYKSKYIPRIQGILLILSGLGYFATSLQPYLFPAINLSLAVYTYYGELIFMLWLLMKGSKIAVPTEPEALSPQRGDLT